MASTRQHFDTRAFRYQNGPMVPEDSNIFTGEEVCSAQRPEQANPSFAGDSVALSSSGATSSLLDAAARATVGRPGRYGVDQCKAKRWT